MNTLEIRDFLQSIELFADTPPNTLSEIATIAHHKKITQDQLLIEEGSAATAMYVITQGEFSVYKSSTHQEENIEAQLTYLHKRDVVGEFSFLDQQSRSANVKALTDNCTALEIPYSDLKNLASESIYRKLAKRLSTHIRTSNEAIIRNLQRELIQNKKMANMGRFISYVLLLMAFYDLALKGFVSLATNPYTSMFTSTSVIFIFTFVLIVMVRRMDRPLSHYGLNINNWQKSLRESLFFTFILILVLTGLKLLFFPHSPLMDPADIIPEVTPGTTQYYTLLSTGIVVYSIFAIFQEFISRGILQSSLQDFLQTKHKSWAANLIASGIFSAMHIHLSATLAFVVFIPSLFWGWLYMRQQSLLGPIVSHILIGAWAIFGLGIQEILK